MRTLAPWFVPLVSALILFACGGDRAEVTQLPLTDLVRFSERYDGERVETSGRIHSLPDPRHYWLEDGALHRVALQPATAVAERVDERVRVLGRFKASRKQGRSLTVEQVTPLDTSQ